MCSNRAVVDSLECYMDDLVDCFEGFVKKSLIILSFGIGLIVAMLAYLLKVICERQPIRNTVTENAMTAQNQRRNIEPRNEPHKTTEQTKLQDKLSQNNSQKDNLLFPGSSSVNQAATGVNTSQKIQSMPSYDEQVLRNIGFSSCCKPTCIRKNINNEDMRSRVPVPSLTTSPPNYKSIHSIRLSKHNISTVQLCSRAKKGSKCSICSNETTTR